MTKKELLRLMNNTNISEPEKTFIIRLDLMADIDGVLESSNSKLADIHGVTPIRIVQYFNKLKDLGLVSKETIFTESGYKEGSRIKINYNNF